MVFRALCCVTQVKGLRGEGVTAVACNEGVFFALRAASSLPLIAGVPSGMSIDTRVLIDYRGSCTLKSSTLMVAWAFSPALWSNTSQTNQITMRSRMSNNNLSCGTANLTEPYTHHRDIEV